MDFGSKSLPIEIPAGESLTLLMHHRTSSDKVYQWEFFIDAGNVLLTEVLEYETRLEPTTNADQK